LRPKLVVKMTRADMHCHPVPGASAEDLYRRAKLRGMDFVTIVARDSIDEVLRIADRPDVFMSVELTASFRDGNGSAQVLCSGISEFDHRWLQRHRSDARVCIAYLNEHSVAWELADQAEDPYVYTETPYAETPWEFLAHVRRGWATTHSATELALAAA
jgi:hypothetical protein